jgi:hypothetical protein
MSTLHNSHKGAYFIAILKPKLLYHNFLVAVPEPDLGEDLWIVKSGECTRHLSLGHSNLDSFFSLRAFS